MKSKIQISIPTPCHQNWQNMAVADKGRLCSSCQKNVIDFTKSSDREILKAFDNNNNLCGRFNDSQLNRDLFVPKEKNTVWIAAASGILTFLGLGTDNINAQQKTEQTVNDKTIEFSAENNMFRTIKGAVKDSSGLSLPGVTISIDGNNRQTQTDFDGLFSIKATTGEKLLVTYYGMKNIEVIIDDRSFFDIQMEELLLEMQVINTGMYHKSAFSDSLNKNKPREVMGSISSIKNCDIENRRNRTFLGRIFHSIGNLFR